MEIKRVGRQLPFSHNWDILTRGAKFEQETREVISNVSDESISKLKSLLKDITPCEVTKIDGNSNISNEILGLINNVSKTKKFMLNPQKETSILKTPERIDLLNGFTDEESGVFMNLYI